MWLACLAEPHIWLVVSVSEMDCIVEPHIWHTDLGYPYLEWLALLSHMYDLWYLSGMACMADLWYYIWSMVLYLEQLAWLSHAYEILVSGSVSGVACMAELQVWTADVWRHLHGWTTCKASAWKCLIWMDVFSILSVDFVLSSNSIHMVCFQNFSSNSRSLLFTL